LKDDDRMSKSRKICCKVHAGLVTDKRKSCMLLVGEPEGTRSLASPGIGGCAVLILILKNKIGGCGV
jgi:hypothetical protein